MGKTKNLFAIFIFQKARAFLFFLKFRGKKQIFFILILAETKKCGRSNAGIYAGVGATTFLGRSVAASVGIMVTVF